MVATWQATSVMVTFWKQYGTYTFDWNLDFFIW